MSRHQISGSISLDMSALTAAIVAAVNETLAAQHTLSPASAPLTAHETSLVLSRALAAVTGQENYETAALLTEDLLRSGYTLTHTQAAPEQTEHTSWFNRTD